MVLMFNYPDASGGPHSFSDVDFTNFAVCALKAVIGGVSGNMPSAEVRISSSNESAILSEQKVWGRLSAIMLISKSRKKNVSQY
jgi:hypothetical protein